MRSKRLGERFIFLVSLPPSSPIGESTSLIRGRLAAPRYEERILCLFSKQLAQAAQGIAQLIHVQLCLDAVDQGIELVVR